ncbi:MAG: hypothetical protein GY898_30930 [Proteobacteria bacterium]|nr:hypothetical protein [Pseudomonadota bacterium]
MTEAKTRRNLLIGCGVLGCLGMLMVGGLITGVGVWHVVGQTAEFGEDHPHAVQISEVRSVYHARQMQERLEVMGVESEISAVRDAEGAGLWYVVLAGATDDPAAVRETRQLLQNTHQLDGLELVNWYDLAVRVVDQEIGGIEEQALVVANTPHVGSDVVEVVQRYPYSNVFNVERLTVYLSPGEGESLSRYGTFLNVVGSDLPRGTTRNLILGQTLAWSEAILTDNLYGDRVTLNVLKLKPDHGIEGDVADYYSQRILDTGRYTTELVDPFDVMGTERLIGNKVTIEPRAGTFRVYVILVDPTGGWVYFSQSTEKTDEELKEVLALIGRSNGMFEYSEFYNTFHTIPDVRKAGDSFLGFNMDRLRSAYARNKGNKQWAKQCVGHWSANGFFHNTESGAWSFGIFDLLTSTAAGATYDLYGDTTTGNKVLEVYGASGWVVNEQRWNKRTYKTYQWPNEVNFRQGRYICMVNNAMDSGWLKQEGLVARANSMQLESAGGYASR